MENAGREEAASLPTPCADGRVSLDGAVLKQLRARSGLSQEALADRCVQEKLCVSIASIKRAEGGKPVLYRTARHLATAYRIPLEQLWKRGDGQARDEGSVAPDAAAPAATEPGEETRTVIALQVRVRPDVSAQAVAGVVHLVQQFGGVVDKQLADRLLAVFGMPHAYRSDATRCLQCALQAARLLEQMAVGLSVRVCDWGAGGCRAEPEEDGPALALAEPSPEGPAPIRVHAELAASLVDGFEFVRPVGGPSVWHQLVRRRPPGQGTSSQLVGRYAEVRQFKAIVDSTEGTQAAHFVYLRGAAGVGKSRLLEEFSDIARQARFQVHHAAVLDFGVEAGGGALGQLARSLLGLSALDDAEADEPLEEALRRAAVTPEQQMFLRTLLARPLAGAQASIYAAMTHATRLERCAESLALLMLRAATASPMAVFVEDVHWGDAQLFETLATLFARTQCAPVVWVLSSRPENDPFARLVRPPAGELPQTVFGLAPLRPGEAEALALQFDEVAPAYRRQCVERAHGNPLFLTQMLISSHARRVPDSLKHLVQGQMDRLAPQDRRAVRAAAAIGQRFHLGLLRELLQSGDYRPEPAEATHLVRQVEPEAYLFVHDLVMQCIYEAMAPAQRDYLHKALAALYRPRDLSLCAQHLHRARDPQAPATLVAAAREKLAAHAYEAALELLELARGIGYAPVDAYGIALLGAEAALKTGRTQQAREGFEQAVALARQPREHLEAVLGLARTLNLLEDLGTEAQLLDAALPVARSVVDQPALAQLLYLKGNMYFPRGDFATSRLHHEQALAHARACGATRTEALALSGLGDSYYAEGRMKQAHGVFGACLALCQEHGCADVEASNRFMLATTAIYLGHTEVALADALASATLGMRVGNRRAEIVSRLTASWVLTGLGRAQEAREQVDAGLALVYTLKAGRFEPFLLEALARVCLVEGGLAQAQAHAVRAWSLVEERKLERFIGPWVLGTLALVSTQDAQRQSGALARGLALLEAGCVAHNTYRFLVSAAECALVQGRPAEALARAEQLDRFTRPEPCLWSDHHVARVRAHAAWLQSPDDARRAALARCVEEGERAGLGFTMPLLRQAA